MTDSTLLCPTPTPRDGSQGIEVVAVSSDQRRLLVTFIANVTDDSPLLQPNSYALTGGRRLHPQVVEVTSDAHARQLILQLDQSGDFSLYTLTVSGDTIDPFFAAKRFSFKIECEDPFDCRPPAAPSAPALAEGPAIDYLTKDYAGFRRLLLDQLSTRLPEWTERSEADLGIALVELMAEAADRLSYYQDRVANEAYLSTATQRRSVQLHTALIGYRLRPAVAAATLLDFEVLSETLIPAGTQVQTRTRGEEPPTLFETGPGDFLVRPEHNQLSPYTWDKAKCCLLAGATEITVEGSYPELRVGEALLIADAKDPDRREIVTLSERPRILPPDPIKGHPTQRLTVLRWSEAQALKFEYCLDQAQTVVRGNLVPATHGRSLSEENLGRGDESLKRLRFTLNLGPLTYLAAEMEASLKSTLVIKVTGQEWEERESLIESGPFDRHYRVELDDEGYPALVFGDGVHGQKPPTGSRLSARYRVGAGPVGNVGRDTLIQLVEPKNGIAHVTNPLPARGGQPADDKDEARHVAPLVIRTPVRCVTEADYERAATEYREHGLPRVQRAKARFSWTGSWHTVYINVDPAGSQALPESSRAGLRAYLEQRKLAGYDLEISTAVYAPLEVSLRVCVRPEFFAADVRANLLQALSNQGQPDGSRGFFHPDNFSFGDPVVISRLYAAIEAVPGVDSVVVTRFGRLHQPNLEAATADHLRHGRLLIGELEIARLDNDPSFPENGRLTLQMLGGK